MNRPAVPQCTVLKFQFILADGTSVHRECEARQFIGRGVSPGGKARPLGSVILSEDDPERSEGESESKDVCISPWQRANIPAGAEPALSEAEGCSSW